MLACLPEPAPDNAFLAGQVHILHSSFRYWLGYDLGGMPWQGEETARQLFDAPFVLLAHNTAADPVFTYGNRQAMQVFALDWPALTALPSRYSAEPLERTQREHLLQTVARQGYIDHYAGVRIARTGQRFRIENAIVWNLQDAAGHPAGQAACFDRWIDL